MNDNSENLKLWQKSWFMWVCLFFICPVGIVLCYLNRERHPRWKAICLAFAALFIIGIAVPQNNTTDTTANNAGVQTSEKKAENENKKQAKAVNVQEYQAAAKIRANALPAAVESSRSSLAAVYNNMKISAENHSLKNDNNRLHYQDTLRIIRNNNEVIIRNSVNSMVSDNQRVAIVGGINALNDLCDYLYSCVDEGIFETPEDVKGFTTSYNYYMKEFDDKIGGLRR